MQPIHDAFSMDEQTDRIVQPLSIVRPTPLYPLDEVPLNLNPSSPSARSSEQLDFPLATPPQLYQLPVKGPPDGAQAALEKLEKIQKKNYKANRWRNKARSKQNPPRHIPSQADSDSSSGDSVHLGRAFQEVKLIVTSLPGHPVVGRVRNIASRARERFHRGDVDSSPYDSPQAEQPSDFEPYRFPFTRVSGLSKRASVNKAALHPGSRPYTPPFFNPTAPSSSSPIVAKPSPDKTLPHLKSPFASQNPELLVVDEEGREKQAEQDETVTVKSSPSFRAHTRAVGTQGGECLGYPLASQLQIGLNSTSTGGRVPDAPQPHQIYTSSKHNLAPPSPSSRSSSDSSSSDEAGQSESSGDLSDEEGDVPKRDLDLLKHLSLQLDHGQPLSKEEIKHRNKLIRREKRHQKTQGELYPGRASHIGHQVSHQVSKGLHYASTQSRNKRAMERYSPNPIKQLNRTTNDSHKPSSLSGTLPEPSTNLSTLFTTPTNSGYQQNKRESVSSSRRGSLLDNDAVSHTSPLQETIDETPLTRWNTGNMSIASSKRSLRNYLNGSKLLRRNRLKNSEAELASLEASLGSTSAAKLDPERELDQMLGNLAMEQAPSEANKVKYEFDVLYENQRGLLVFGIPKFSPRTLMQWDPSPWTSANNKSSPYNIANAQLPDPSWEWIYPEWLIDMTQDTDEAGWQYSGNFGRRFWPNIHFPHGKVGLPRTGTAGINEMNARLADKEAKRREKESKKEDDGFEALKRSARARSSKWKGTPDPWTFVRRRRWIRLRRRKPIVGPQPKHSPANEELAQKWPAAATPEIGQKKGKRPVQKIPNDDEKAAEADSESSLSSSDEEDDSDVSQGSDGYAFASANPSAFLPRRLPGNLSNGPDPLKYKDPVKIHEARRRAKQFTGTLVELKSLLPAIMAYERDNRHTHTSSAFSLSQHAHKLALHKLNNIDARNPFICWKYVKLRLEDGDFAFASATLRAMERKYQQRKSFKCKGKEKDDLSKRALPPEFKPNVQSPLLPTYGDALAMNVDGTGEPPPSSEGKELKREALIEINFERVARVFKACKVDRQRLDLWKVWLGLESIDSLVETARNEDLKALGPLDVIGGSPISMGAPVHLSGASCLPHQTRADKARAKWKKSVSTPDPSDVWDVLERRLDDLLMLFEFQFSRAMLIRILLEIHEFSHPEHVYRDRSMRSNPVELSPTHVHGRPQEMGGVNPALAQEGWMRAELPRLEFYSDLQAVLHAMPGGDVQSSNLILPPVHSLGAVGSLEAGSASSISILHDLPPIEVLHLPPSRSGTPASFNLISRTTSPVYGVRSMTPLFIERARSSPHAPFTWQLPNRTDSVSPLYPTRPSSGLRKSITIVTESTNNRSNVLGQPFSHSNGSPTNNGEVNCR